MGMDPRYKQLHDQIKQHEFHVHDAIGDPNDRTAQALNNEIRMLLSDLETGKNPHDLEDRVKNIQSYLLQARSHQNSYMNIEHADRFYRDYEDIRRHIREFHDYS